MQHEVCHTKPSPCQSFSCPHCVICNVDLTEAEYRSICRRFINIILSVKTVHKTKHLVTKKKERQGQNTKYQKLHQNRKARQNGRTRRTRLGRTQEINPTKYGSELI